MYFHIVLIGVTITTLYLIRYILLPKPLRGIPHHSSSARRFLGDIPAIKAHIKRTNGSPITFFNFTVESLKSPIAQVFLKPLGMPVILLSDFREARSLLMLRKDFDRSPALGDLLSGLVPDHHIHLKTGAKWKAQRQLVQDVMTPSHLNEVAGPAVLQKTIDLLNLWTIKSKIAVGRPWNAAADLRLMSLDVMLAFAFGPELEHSATSPTLDAVAGLQGTFEEYTSASDEPINFPEERINATLQAMLDLAATVMELHGSPVPSLHWAYLNFKPRIKNAKMLKDQFIIEQLKQGVERLDRATGDQPRVSCAVDQMIIRERILADREGREPQLLSRVMMDELFGFVFAGNETTATTICWGLKFLSDNRNAQEKLRVALHESLTEARGQKRNPTVHEILHARVPYLDATIEEVLRRAGTSPFVDRQAIRDTQILGHHLPRGTVVLCLLSGPSMWSPGFHVDENKRYGARSKTSDDVEDRGNKSWPTEDISTFKPERWLIPRVRGDGNHEGTHNEQFDPRAGPQLAFGLGPRGCYGRRLVYLEMRILFTLLVWRFELMKCPTSLSGYGTVLRATNEPEQCFLRLRAIS
ncbi:cytochrome P450 [Lentithecium fluviatile CBS 122367]|uniref:Cytochrome P450 n=1 Tax=Lentithecium fluviatile CBS 122367 TaxID=1168545 RepID=A0A6G1ITY9_9PLEO|nr:cytochrome P450 [Lentithecium fluviatile CBS 122367]